MEKYGFVYLWFDKGRNRFYLGAHWGSKDDGYICSSTWMRNSKIRRPNDFKRRIISEHKTKEETFAAEFKLLQLIKDEELGVKYYNKHKNIKISDGSPWNKGKKGLKIHSQEYKDRLSKEKSGSNNYFYGKSFSGELHPMYGKKHTEESKKKMSESSKGCVSWNKGKHWNEEFKKNRSETYKLQWQDPEFKKMVLEKRRKSLNGD